LSNVISLQKDITRKHYAEEAAGRTFMLSNPAACVLIEDIQSAGPESGSCRVHWPDPPGVFGQDL